MFKNPRLNSYVYILTCVDGEPFCISKDKVYMKNKESFIPEGVFNESVIDEYKKQYFFKEYGIFWFERLKDIRKYLEETCEPKYKIIKVYGDGWNIEEKER